MSGRALLKIGMANRFGCRTVTGLMPSVRWPRSALLNQNCGADRDRTDDLLHAMQALSQLSYSPSGGVGPLGRHGHPKLCEGCRPP
jgi:hypothetical protein